LRKEQRGWGVNGGPGYVHKKVEPVLMRRERGVRTEEGNILGYAKCEKGGVLAKTVGKGPNSLAKRGANLIKFIKKEGRKKTGLHSMKGDHGWGRSDFISGGLC